MMGGSMLVDDWELPNSPSNLVRTLVLFGRTGNGKSATGNTILGDKKAFNSKKSSSGVTENCELQRTVLSDGQIINVIDTPGLFDTSAGSEFIATEIGRCIKMTRDWVHAVLVVFSARNRFIEEEVAVVRSLQAIFGSRILDYIIVVFTGGDDFEDNEETTFEGYLGSGGPAHPLKELLVMCKNRFVLFDNKTIDEGNRVEQVEKLLSLVNVVVAQNGGLPYTDELFAEWKKAEIILTRVQGELKRITEMKAEIILTRVQGELKRITEMIELKFKEAMNRLEEQLAEEKAVRLKAKEQARLNQEKSNDEIRKLREQLSKTAGELGRHNGNQCAIL